MPIAEQTEIETLQSAQDGNNDGTAISMIGYGRFTIQVTVSGFTGTVNFEGTIDDTNWFAVTVDPIGGGSAVTTATGAGVFRNTAAGVALSQLRARTSSVSGGTVTVKARKERA